MTTRRNFMIGGASAVAVPLVASGAVLATLPPLAAPVMPLINHGLTDAFCGVQEIEHMRSPWYYISPRRWADTSDFGFVVQKNHPIFGINDPSSALHYSESTMGSYPTNNPINLFRKLKQVEILDNKFDLNRCANRIAACSRRGRGRVVLYNKALSRPPQMAELCNAKWADSCDHYYFNLIDFNQLGRNEYVILYKGASKYDGAIFKIVAPGALAYFAHKNFSDYAIRFRLGQKRFDPDELPPRKTLMSTSRVKDFYTE